MVRKRPKGFSAQADRTVVELVSDANREAEIVRGEADAERNAHLRRTPMAQMRISSASTARSRAYERALRGQQLDPRHNTPDSEFFEFLDGAGMSGLSGTASSN